MNKNPDLDRLLAESESLVLSRVNGGWIAGWDRCTVPLACRTVADVVQVLCAFLRVPNRTSESSVFSFDEPCPIGSRLILSRILKGYLVTACHGTEDPAQFVRFENYEVIDVVRDWLGAREDGEDG